MIDATRQDIRRAIRAFRSSPGFAAVAILSLALGIGANTAIFSLIDSLILKTLPVSHPEQLLQVTMNKTQFFSNPAWEQLRDRQDVFSGIIAYGRGRFNLAAGGESRFAQGNYASGQFFETLGLNAMLGRTFTPADDQRGCAGIVVLSNGFWQREYAGRADIVGKAISLDNQPFEIVGVLRPGFAGVEVGYESDLYVPLCTEKVIHGAISSLDNRSISGYRIIGRPKPDISATQVDARLKTLAGPIFDTTVPLNWKPEEQDSYRKRTLDTQLAANGFSNLRGQYRQALFILMAIVGLVLLIACANVANLLLARGTGRQREIAIRIALGSSRRRLIRQLLTESLTLSLAGAALGILFAQWGARLLVSYLSSGQNRVFLDLSIDARVLAFTIGVAILTGLLFGLAPAWRSTRVNPQSAMKANARGITEGGRFRVGRMLLVAQVALSLVLLVGAGLMLSTFLRLQLLDPGFAREQVLLVNVDLRNVKNPPIAEMLDRLRTLPGIHSASGSGSTPISGSVEANYIHVEGYAAKGRGDTLVFFNRVSDRFFETLGMNLLTGRDFNVHDTPESPKVAIVNQTMAKKFFGEQNPVGKWFRPDTGNKPGEPIEIVGLVKDAKYDSLRDEIPAAAYLASSQSTRISPFVTFELRVAGGPPTAAISAVKASISEFQRDASFQFKTLATQVDESLARERLLATLSGFFGGTALILAMMGLYGVVSYEVNQRRNEIGIRIALGAETSHVLHMVLTEVWMLIGVGLVIGLGLALATTRFVESFLYGVKPNDPWTLFLAVSTLAIVASLAGFMPARRASRLDPMQALREE